jgi:hypothetical protein
VTAAVDTSPLYATLLVAHVLISTVVLLQVVMAVREAGVLAGLNSAAAMTDVQRRYYATASAIFSRMLYLVPVSGGLLIATSRGSVRASETWVLIGLALWVVAIVHVEVGVLRGEASIRAGIDGPWDGVVAAAKRTAAMGRAVGAIMALAAVVMVLQPG